MKTVKLLALLLCALRLSDAQWEGSKKGLFLDWTTVERGSQSPEMYRINSLSCRQEYCELKILYIWGCNVSTSMISSVMMRTDGYEGLEVTRTGNTVDLLLFNGQGTRERLTYKVTSESPQFQTGRVIQYEGQSQPTGRHGNKLEPLKGNGWARVSIPCPVTVPAMEQD
jgi:hypothetical protein